MAPTTPAITKTPLAGEAREQEIDRNNELEASRNGEGDDIETSERGFIDPDGGADDQGGETQPEARETVRMSPGDAKREAMINRFKRGDVDPFDGDMTRPENLYGRAAQEDLEPETNGADAAVVGGETQEEIDAELAELTGQQPSQQQQERTFKIKVRGQEVVLTESQLLERAQKVSAADSYLEETRELLKQAKQARGERTAPDQQHPAGEDGANDGLDNDLSTQRQHQAGDVDLKSVVEKIQYGDPEEAANLLDDVIAKRVQRGATVEHVNRLVTNDLARSQQDLKKFRADNPDLDKDKVASGVIENLIYDVYREEIRGLGVDESQIPRDPKQLADWHRLYRVHGHEVSKTSDVLNKAKDRYLAWRGDAPKKEAPRKGAADVRVNVDRTERRMNIPQQPSRSVVPRANPTKPQSVEQSRQGAVAEMRKARGQLTG